MTDLSQPTTTYTAPSVTSNVRPVSSIERTANVSTPNGVPAEDEEDYTIKCFCGFQVDDGLTVFCDRCETWQHIECYYFKDFQDGVPPDGDKIEHTCVDCDYRPYDKKGATERQKDRFRPEERKAKKAPTKAPKKRMKTSESNVTLTNGYSHDGNDSHHDPTNRSPRDHGPPTKRPKTSHRTSHSNNYFSPPPSADTHGARAPGSTSHASRKGSSKQPLNGHSSQPYSPEFLCLYDNDPGEDPMQANLFNDIAITRSLSSWSHDVDSLSEATNRLSPQDVFHRLQEPLGRMNLPSLSKQQRFGEPSDVGDRQPRWITLSVDTDIPKEGIVGELKGQIGHMQDYVHEPANRWDYLRHPTPFVFFHPKLPIYIDTRQQGSICRYIRRSCQPNLEMRTILENTNEYHFCFIAKEDIRAGSELTISWTLDEHIRKCFNSPEIKREGNFDVMAYVSDWVEKVLANFGGCACESPEQCGLAKYDRRAETHGAMTLTNGRTSKARNGYTTFTRTPDAARKSQSRASSEGRNRQDEDTRNSRSTSSSKSRSREATPTRNGRGAFGGVPGLEITDREKRKIAAMEKNLEQLEQEKQQPSQKRKKRNSGGSSLSTPTAASSKQLGHGIGPTSQPNTPGPSTGPRYVGTSFSGKKSGSPIYKPSRSKQKPDGSVSAKRQSRPNTPALMSSLARPNYVSVSMQTDPDEEDFSYKPPVPPIPKRRYISWGKRLLIRCQQDRERMDEYARLAQIKTDRSSEKSLAPELGSINSIANEQKEGQPLPSSSDIEMQDIARIESPQIEAPQADQSFLKQHSPDDEARQPGQSRSPEIKPPPPPAATNNAALPPRRDKLVNGFRSSDLRVQLPSSPQYPHDPSSAPPMTVATTSVIPRSPFAQASHSYPPLLSGSTSGITQPSPVKKVSLGEYFSRRKTESQSIDKGTASSALTQQNATKTMANVDEEPKNSSVEGNAVMDMPKKEESHPSNGHREPA